MVLEWKHTEFLVKKTVPGTVVNKEGEKIWRKNMSYMC